MSTITSSTRRVSDARVMDYQELITRTGELEIALRNLLDLMEQGALVYDPDLDLSAYARAMAIVDAVAELVEGVPETETVV